MNFYITTLVFLFCCLGLVENNLEATLTQCQEYVPYDCKQPCQTEVMNRCEGKEGMIRDEMGYIDCDSIGQEIQTCLNDGATYQNCVKQGNAACQAKYSEQEMEE